LHSKEWADAHADETLSKAHGEEAARSGIEVYKQQGFDAAVEHLRKNILENENLSLKPESRYRAFSRGMQAIRLQRQQDMSDKAGIIQSSVDLRARINSGQPYDDGEVRDTAAALGQVGAIAEQRNLVVAHTAKRMAPPGLTLPERATTVDVARGVAANYMRGELPGPGALVQIQTPGGIRTT